MFQNNLNASDDQNHVGASLLDPMLSVNADEACNTISETLLSRATIQNYSTDLADSLSYLSYKYGICPTSLIKSGQVNWLSLISFQSRPHSKLLFRLVCQKRHPKPGYQRATSSRSAYQKTLAAVEETGPWDKVTHEDGPLKFLDYPARTGDFQDKPPCAWLNYNLSYYSQ